MGLYMGHFEAGFPSHSRTMPPPRNDPSGTRLFRATRQGFASCLAVVFNKEIPMTNPDQKPGQQNQNPGQKPGQQQGGGQKPGQQQQDPGRQDQQPKPDQKAGK